MKQEIVPRRDNDYGKVGGIGEPVAPPDRARAPARYGSFERLDVYIIRVPYSEQSNGVLYADVCLLNNNNKTKTRLSVARGGGGPPRIKNTAVDRSAPRRRPAVINRAIVCARANKTRFVRDGQLIRLLG
ncbi:hypothetical protein EVAR_88854_1 [Eumeta japonica]|uniref:Uncharacterized protein n=1 Tax=Eumeta variegata TaxID=151549 RepID=A0A4C1Y7Y8_EUMVA|nr:hypothetical protein EVAR_88854_1 [Eumeta japonica]